MQRYVDAAHLRRILIYIKKRNKSVKKHTTDLVVDETTKCIVSKFFSLMKEHPSLIIRLNDHQRGAGPSIINTSICSHILLPRALPSREMTAVCNDYVTLR